MQNITSIESQSPADIRSLMHAIEDGQRPSAKEALSLLQLTREEDIHRLRELADETRKRQVGDSVLYTTGRSFFLTNLCELEPSLYPYPKKPGDTRTYVLTIDDIDAGLEQASRNNIRQIYVSGGGYWPYLQIPGMEAPGILKTYAKLFRYIQEKNGFWTITGLSPDEIDFLCVVSDRSDHYILEMLKDQGLQILGGNGTEILVDSVRQAISPRKATIKRWFEIVATAHKLKIPAIAKIEASPLETLQQRVAHLEHLRHFIGQYPDAFTALGPQMWTQLPAGFEGSLPNTSFCSHQDRFKLTAVMRLFLGDVLPNQQIFWQPGAPQQEAQEGLQWGANAFGATDNMSYPAFLSGSSQENEIFTESDFQALIADTGRNAEIMRQNYPIP